MLSAWKRRYKEGWGGQHSRKKGFAARCRVGAFFCFTQQDKPHSVRMQTLFPRLRRPAVPEALAHDSTEYLVAVQFRTQRDAKVSVRGVEWWGDWGGLLAALC